MQPVQTNYPVRLFIRHKAKVKLAEALHRQRLNPVIDALLLQEVTNTMLQPSVNAEAYQACRSRAEAMRVEESVSDAIAAAYVQILKRRTDADVRRLNSLL